MSEKISSSIRERIAEDAKKCCEYCLLPESVSFFSFHIDHIRSIKHGGLSIAENLAYCCPDCNFFKGSDVGTFDFKNDSLIRFFNPRKDIWTEHFFIGNGSILSKSDIGRSTEKIFKFNEIERLVFRKQLIELALYLPGII
jgi:HNH endonuclease